MSVNALHALNRLLAPIKRRISVMASRALITLIDDSNALQFVQASISAEELMDNVARFQEFGFSSAPLPGAQAIILCMNGVREHPIVIAVEDGRYRKKNLAGGETAIYNSDGDYVWIKRSGQIEIKASTKVTVTAPLVECTGNVTIDGNLTVTGTTTSTGAISTPSSVKALGGVSASATAPVAGQLTDSVSQMSNLRSIYNSHVHAENGVSGSPNTNTTTQTM